MFLLYACIYSTSVHSNCMSCCHVQFNMSCSGIYIDNVFLKSFVHCLMLLNKPSAVVLISSKLSTLYIVSLTPMLLDKLSFFSQTLKMAAFFFCPGSSVKLKEGQLILRQAISNHNVIIFFWSIALSLGRVIGGQII